MIHLVEASCLSNLIQNLKHQKDEATTREISTTVRGLSVNSKTEKNIQGLIGKISNSISEHKSKLRPLNKCYRPLNTPTYTDDQGLQQAR